MKLPSIYNFSTDVSIFPLLNQKDLEKIFYISLSKRNEQTDSEYRLKKIATQRKLPENNYHRYQKELVYYQEKDNTITTAIRCYSDLPANLKCQHYFVYKNFIFKFGHRTKDIKNWRRLQDDLTAKIESWQEN